MYYNKTYIYIYICDDDFYSYTFVVPMSQEVFNKPNKGHNKTG